MTPAQPKGRQMKGKTSSFTVTKVVEIGEVRIGTTGTQSPFMAAMQLIEEYDDISQPGTYMFQEPQLPKVTVTIGSPE